MRSSAPGKRSDEPNCGAIARWWPLIGLVVVVALFPLDNLLSRALSSLPIKLDLAVGLRTVQQFGDLLTMALTFVLIWQLDPARRKRLADLLAAAALVALVCLVLKVTIGRPRPEIAGPDSIVGPFRPYEMTVHGQPERVYSWHVHNPAASRLWSMPSSHAALAVVLGVFLTALYPPLFWFCVVMVALVCFGRVHFEEHYPTDVIVGAAVACVISRWVIGGRRGEALIRRWRGEEPRGR